MVQAWLISAEIGDQFAPNHDPVPHFLTIEEVERRTGVTAQQVPVDSKETLDDLKDIPSAQKYSHFDVVEVSRQCMGDDFEKKLRIFFEEHLHTDDEVRFILDGTGYFDVRDKDDQWIRIAVSRGDFLTLPAGIYHRFTTDKNQFLKAMRLFIGVPVWTPVNRGQESDHLDVRRHYLKEISSA